MELGGLNPSIREARLEDYPVVCELFSGLDAYHLDLDPTRLRSFEGPARSRDRYSELLSDLDGFFFVAEHEGALVGFVNGRLGSAPPYPMYIPRKLVHVANLYVSPSGRRMGLGRKLMDTAWHWGQGRGAESIALDVLSANESALAFYRGMGFAETRLRMEWRE